MRAVRQKILPLRQERLIRISVLQEGHFSCIIPLTVPNLKAKIFLHVLQRTATFWLLSISFAPVMIFLLPFRCNGNSVPAEVIRKAMSFAMIKIEQMFWLMFVLYTQLFQKSIWNIKQMFE